jgi:hypothetical protein
MAILYYNTRACQYLEYELERNFNGSHWDDEGLQH